MKIIPYDARYRDDMIFMVLQAKDALGRVPRLNEDLLDVPGNYLNRGDGFWLALDEGDRVIGCVGFSRIPGTEEVAALTATAMIMTAIPMNVIILTLSFFVE